MRWLTVSLLVLGCGGSLPTVRQQADEVEYNKRITDCAKYEPTLEASKACRAKVDAEWKARHPDGSN